MPSKLKKAIGAVKDQTSIGLARVSSVDATISNLEVAVLRATTHDDEDHIDPRHVQEILSLVSSNKSNAAACARAIGKRIGRTRTWAVAIKSLVLVLRIFQDGDPYFPREVLHAMKRGAKILNLSSFRDDSSSSSPWDYSAFVRTFSLYLDERLDCILTGKLQRRMITNPRGADADVHHSRHHRSMSGKLINETLREMKPGMLLDKISCWQELLDRAVATRPTGAAKTNNLVKISLYAIVHESFHLYKDISDGLALLLEGFFELPYNSCVNVFQTCMKATKQFEELAAFYDLCKSIGVGRASEYPTIQRISEELLQSLQEFLKDRSSFSITKDYISTPKKSMFSFPTINDQEPTHRPSLEDLLSATELSSGKDQPSISIDLETYSINHDRDFEKQMLQTSTKNGDDTCSTKSLPSSNSNSIMNLLDDWPNKDVQDNTCEQIEPIPPISWELVLFDQDTDNNKISNNGFEDLLGQSHEGWELMLTQTVTPSSAQTPDKPFQQHYNPFLQDTPENDEHIFNTIPTFQVTPTFQADTVDSIGEFDPFARVVSEEDDQSFGTMLIPQNLEQQQQMWLQQQNKIIERQVP
ncbi:clathrin coat assembly protein AP180-like [Impatiens glandulifera]|uniref:clathrin coat assembly protein AP180-like n=1 Tax=Impatiens glandulifera TaxID=253017 RepID=UPI001FB07D82|nr:clathrin coat assembly protein AP180-like [Impatiens glandulifera]